MCEGIATRKKGGEKYVHRCALGLFRFTFCRKRKCLHKLKVWGLHHLLTHSADKLVYIRYLFDNFSWFSTSIQLFNLFLNILFPYSEWFTTPFVCSSRSFYQKKGILSSLWFNCFACFSHRCRHSHQVNRVNPMRKCLKPVFSLKTSRGHLTDWKKSVSISLDLKH